MPALNGYGTLTEDENGSVTADTAAETFVTDGLAKVLKINNICDSEHLADCGMVKNYTDAYGSTKIMPDTLYSFNSWFRSAEYIERTFSTINTKAVAFETQNGESIIVFYNPNCRTEFINEEQNLELSATTHTFPQSNMCVNFVYDLNGNKGPNTIAKDMGIITVFNSVDAIVVAPVLSTGKVTPNVSWENSAKTCTNENPESRLPNIDEGSAIMLSKNILGLNDTAGVSGFYRTSSVFNARMVWEYNISNGVRQTEWKTGNRNILCIKR